MRSARRDVVVVGGGLLGLLVAEQLASKNRDVDVLVSPRPDPRSDSQRNHSWLQSGLLYPGNISARRMFYDGLEMLDHFGYPRPDKHGIFRFSSEREVEIFLSHASEIRLRRKVREVRDNEARRLLGPFYQPNHFHFEVPDAPFPEASLMETARKRAKQLGVRFNECYVELERDESAQNGYVVLAGDERVAPENTLVCAGAGTPKLLRSLDLAHPLVVNQSNLLVLSDISVLGTPLFADRTTGLTVISWRVSEGSSRGRLVIGANDRRRLPAEGEDLDRRILPLEEEFLLSLLPQGWDVAKQLGRFTPGQKTDLLVDGKPVVAPWINAPEEFPGLVFGTPGKATLAFGVAQRMAARVERAESSHAPPLTKPLLETEWKAPIRAHHESYFDKPEKREDNGNSEGQKKHGP